MKTRADLEALKRELDQRLRVLNNDGVYLDTPKGRYAVNVLSERRDAVEIISNNLILLDWVVNPNTDVKRADLVNQDKV